MRRILTEPSVAIEQNMMFMFGLQHLSHANLTNKVRGKYVVKEVFMRLPSCILIVTACVLYSCVCFHCVGMYPVYICDYATIVVVFRFLRRQASILFIAAFGTLLFAETTNILHQLATFSLLGESSIRRSTSRNTH